MIRRIAGFHQDEAGDWVAELSCLHRQHVRHRPPFAERPWVLDEQGRAARLGAAIGCPLCDRAELPDDLVLLRTAGPWTGDEVPAALRRAHRTAEGVWARVAVLEGSARLHLAVEPPVEVTLGPGQAQPIPPTTVHDVVVDGPVRLSVEFWGRR